MPATPGRKTFVTIDHKVVVATQPAWWLDLGLDKISRGLPPDSQNVTYIKNVGWRISEFQESLHSLHEQTDADDRVEAFSTPTTAAGSGILSVNHQRQASELPWLGAVSTRTSGDAFLTKQYVADDPDPLHDAADAAAFPPPFSGEESVPMDRVGIGATHEPNEGLSLRFFVPSVPVAATQRTLRIYFTGLPTYSLFDDLPGGSPGTGQYALDLGGDGIATLVELRESGAWIIRKLMRWCSPHLIAGSWHYVQILSDARETGDGDWVGSRIMFRFAVTSTNLQGVLGMAINILNPDIEEYVVFQKVAKQPTISPLRLDIRRDVFCDVQVSRAKHKPTGTLRTVTVALPFKPLGEEPIQVTLFGILPTDTSWSVTLTCFDTGAVCAPVGAPLTGTVSNGQAYLLAKFTPVSGKRRYFATITENATASGNASPTLERITFVRNAARRVTSPTPIEISGSKAIEKVGISGPDDDPTHETAEIVITDLTGELTRLDERAHIPIRIEVAYDPADLSKRSIVFQGYLEKAVKHWRGEKESTYPTPYFGTYRCTCLGMWSKLAKAKAPKQYNFAQAGPDNQAPYKASDAIRALLQGAGLADHQIDVPDLAPRLHATKDQTDVLIVEPLTPLLPLIVDLAREYFGAYVHFDANATNGGDGDDKLGCWRVIVPRRPPYSPLAHFRNAPEGPASGRASAIAPASYPDEDDVPVTFIRKESLHTWVEAPGGNWVRVVGVGGGGVLGAGDGRLEAQPLYNWPAADFNQEDTDHPEVDPDHPDYTDGDPELIYYSNPAINTQSAADWVSRRIFEADTHAKHWAACEAPLILVEDPGDSLAVRPRPLRFGDPCTFQEKTSIVGSCNPAWAGGRGQNQMAAYEFFRVPALEAEWAGVDLSYKAVLGRVR